MSLIGPGFKCSICGGENPLTEVKIFGYNLRQILEMERFYITNNGNRPKGDDSENKPIELWKVS